MTVTINGTTGITDVDGSAGTPALTGTDTNTGIFFPAADTIAFSEGGAEAMRIDSSGNVGIGAATNAGNTLRYFDIVNGNTGASAGSILRLITSNAAASGSVSVDIVKYKNGTFSINNNDTNAAACTTFNVGATERMRIDSSGNLLVGTTTAIGAGSEGAQIEPGNAIKLRLARNTTAVATQIAFFNPNGAVGAVQTTGSATTYNTSSDYRLKNTIAPMADALAKVALLKPCTYKWNVDGSDGQGFIAHELAEVVPACVSGEKDAVDVDGNPEYQGIDTSFLVATLTAAIQEQQAIITALTARITALETP